MSVYLWQILPLSERRKQMYAEEAEKLGITYSEYLGIPIPKQKDEQSDNQDNQEVT